MEWRAATPADLPKLFPAMMERWFKGAAVQIAAYPSWTLWRGETAIVNVTLAPLHSGILECAILFPVGRRLHAGALRELLLRAVTIFPDRIVIVRIDDGNRGGRALARAADFVPIEEFLPGTRIRTWVRRKASADAET